MLKGGIYMAYKLITLRQYKKMNKDEGYNTFLQELPDLTRYYFRNLIVGKEELAELHERFKSLKHYARFIKIACKKEESNPFPDGFSFILTEFIQKFSSAAEEDEELQEVLTIYSKALEKMCKKTAKSISKELDIPKDVALELAVIYPGDAVNKHNAWVFTRELVRRMFQLQKLCCTVKEAAAQSTSDKIEAEKVAKPNAVETTETRFSQFDFANKKLIKKIFKGFFGKDEDILERVYSNLALEKTAVTKYYNEAQKRLWDVITEWLIGAIEKLPAKSVKRIVEVYMQKRSRDHDMDSKRRITLSELDYDTAPKLVTFANPDQYSVKALEKAEKKGKKKDKDKDKKDKKKKKKKKDN
jgi:hypothetical protein